MWVYCFCKNSVSQYIPAKMMKIVESKSKVDSYKYYHVFTGNYFTDVIIANGIPCESHSRYISRRMKEVDSSGKLLKNVLNACDAKPNGMRKRLTKKEFGKIMKKYESKSKMKKVC